MAVGPRRQVPRQAAQCIWTVIGTCSWPRKALTVTAKFTVVGTGAALWSNAEGPLNSAQEIVSTQSFRRQGAATSALLMKSPELGRSSRIV